MSNFKHNTNKKYTIKVTIASDNVYNFDLLVATDVTKSTVVVIPD